MTGNPFPDGYDGPLSALRNNVEDLAVALAIWEARDDTRPDAHARRCANDAVDAIDGALAGLHKIRARLITEIRASDDATAIRADELLAESERSNSGSSGPENTEARALKTPRASEKEKLMPDTLAEPAGIPGGRIMVVYFNHRAALIEVILRFGFTNDILRDPDFAEYEGVELRDARPDPAEGCLMPPDGATIIIGIPETKLLPYEVLAVGWQADGFRHAGFGYREFIVPARIVNRYDRRVYCLDQLHERLRARPGQAQLRQVPEAPEAPLPAAAGVVPAATMPLDGDQVAPRQPASLPAGPAGTRCSPTRGRVPGRSGGRHDEQHRAARRGGHPERRPG